jgi:zinc and cadmium transporter
MSILFWIIGSTLFVSLISLIGIFTFTLGDKSLKRILLEKMVWRHCYEKECRIHAFAYLNLFGHGIHNFIDGLVMAAAFLTSIPLGLATTIAVAAHEIPQEIGDFGVLVYGGIEKYRALFFNLVTALTAMLGGVLGYSLSSYSGGSIFSFLSFIAGIALMWLMKFVLEG